MAPWRADRRGRDWKQRTYLRSVILGKTRLRNEMNQDDSEQGEKEMSWHFQNSRSRSIKCLLGTVGGGAE